MATRHATRGSWATWQRRTIEAVVALLAFAIWGRLAYGGGYRLLVRFAGGDLGGSVLLDLLSLFIGVAGMVAGIAAVWALGMRLLGKTPTSIVGAPDDTAEDYPQRARAEEHARI